MSTRQRSRSAWSRCEEAIARVAPTCTTTCQVCEHKIPKGEWQLGLMFIHVEGFMLMEWYHLNCLCELPDHGLDRILELVQSEMTPAQRKTFQQVLAQQLPSTSSSSSSTDAAADPSSELRPSLTALAVSS